MKQLRLIISALFLISPFAANADPIIDASGKLLGATDVNVGGWMYDVVFADGRCIDVFDGCDSPTDFAFTTAASATAASQALFDQVLLDSALGMFNTDPYLTNHCIPSAFPDFVVCGITTAYGIDAPSGEVEIAFADNWGPNTVGGVDEAYPVGAVVPPGYNMGPPNDDFFAQANIWAVWTPVPEPGTLALFGIGLFGMGLARGRKAA